MFPILSSKQKALQINSEPTIYGTFAEIGAGQEVARYFFQAGGASRTIAKTISAYDMAISDAIYGKGPSGRYVCEKRLRQMLEHECDLLSERLGPTRGERTTFFTFADTVATRRAKGGESLAHGWVGVSFQLDNRAAFNTVVLHVRMLDNDPLQQQEALGILGVNLLHACFFENTSPTAFTDALYHHLKGGRIEINYIDAKGEGLTQLNSSLLNLLLVKTGRTQAILFGQRGEVLLPTEEFYQKHIVVVRGSYRPPTHVNVDMLRCGLEQFCQQIKVDASEVLLLPEISVASVDMDRKDFLDRIELLRTLGHHVLITSFPQYYRLTKYFARYTQKEIGIVLGAYNFKQIFDEEYSSNDGGTMGALGQIFQERVHLYVYPYKEEQDDELITLGNLPIPEKKRELFSYLRQNYAVEDVKAANLDNLHIFSRKVFDLISSGKPGWQKYVPKSVAQKIHDECLFDHPCDHKKKAK